jgi:hypothetical protein
MFFYFQTLIVTEDNPIIFLNVPFVDLDQSLSVAKCQHPSRTFFTKLDFVHFFYKHYLYNSSFYIQLQSTVMSIINAVKAMPMSMTVLALAACGPEINSRYGDENWDPNKTKETFDPIDVPEYEVVYYDQDSADDAEDWEARITIDFTEQSRRSKDGLIVAQFQRGFAAAEVLDDLITSSDSNTSDTKFWNDLEAGEDKRLTATVPGDYKLIFDFDVIWPNGNTVSYYFDDITFTVPGCQTNYVYYEDYINPVLADYCVTCHSSGSAATAMSLSSSNLTTRRNNFLSVLESGLDTVTYDGTVLAWIFDSQHEGQATAASMSSSENSVFRNYVALHQSDTDRNATSDFEFTSSDGSNFCFAKPSTMTVEN